MNARVPTWPTRDEWRSATVLVLVTRAAFLAVAWAGAWFRSGARGRLDVHLTIWRVWDADIYAKIAEHGYRGAGADPYSEAFPPLWPLLIRGVHALGPGLTTAAMLLTTVASVVAVAYLIRLVDEETPGRLDARLPSPGRRAGLYLLVFPTAVFLVAGYSEALFLAGAVAAFREARRRRWVRVGPFAAVAVGARWAGLFLLAGLAVELVRRRPDRAELARGIGALTVGLAPVAAYTLWLWRVHGDAFYFLEAQRLGWGRRFAGPVDAFRATWDTWGSDQAAGLLLAWRIELVAALVGVLLIAVLVRQREWGYATFAGTTMAVMLTSSWYYSIPRILLTLFPLVIVLARWTGRRPARHDAVLAASAILATLGVLTFTRGAWFF